MARSWLVAALLMMGTTHAHAQLPCDPVEIVLPRENDATVASNALHWELQRSGQLVRDTPYTSQPLGAGEHETRTVPDTTPPSTPHPASVLIRDNSHDRNIMSDKELLSLIGNYDADTAILVVDIDDGHSVLHLATTPDRQRLCSYDYQIAPGTATVTITAVDLAGNRSAPYKTTVDVKAPTYHHYYRCGMYMAAIIILGGTAVLVLGPLLFTLVMTLVQRARIRNKSGDAISQLFAENVARIVAREYLILTALGIVTVIVLFRSSYQITAIVASPWVLLSLFKHFVARNMIRVLDGRVQSIERRSDCIYADGHLLGASPRAFDRAARVPTASAGLQRRD